MFCIFILQTVIHLVKLQLIPLEELLQIRNSDTLTGDNIFDAIQKQMTIKPSLRSDIQRFGQLPEQNQNVASIKYNVRTVQGGLKNGDRIRCGHRIGDGSSIIIELGQIFIINHLKMEVVGVIYGYFIEISTDQQIWERIIDYSSYRCYSMQNLFFPSKPVKYVKIVGTSPRDFFLVKMFEAYYRENIPEIRNGFVVPKEKVKQSFFSSEKDRLICLGQPYYIGSMRFYIDDGNSNRKYKFYIETSLNYEDWEKVADKSDEFVNGWQIFRFTSRPIVYVRVTPTTCNMHCNNALLRDFWSKNFECPSSV